MNYLVTFHTHFDAIQYVKFLKNKQSIIGKLRPVPRAVSSSCGTCVTFEANPGLVDLTFMVEGCDNIYLVTEEEKDKYQVCL